MEIQTKKELVEQSAGKIKGKQCQLRSTPLRIYMLGSLRFEGLLLSAKSIGAKMMQGKRELS